MSDQMAALHLKYINLHLLSEIVKQLKDEELDFVDVEHSGGLDGFMSALYNIKLKTKTTSGVMERLLIAKLMKGDNDFREMSKSYVQFSNEVFIYSKVLPSYTQLLKDARITTISVEDWVPHAYIAKFGYIESLSSTPHERESVLVLENLKPLGYKLGPRLYLERSHLLHMSRVVGQYHACSYALRLCNEPLFKQLKSDIIPLPFINDNDPDDAKKNLYRVLYRVAFDRFFDFFDRKINVNSADKRNEDELKLIERLLHLRSKYFDEPTRLLEHIRLGVENFEEDQAFGVILHGDFNRNNVLFRYGMEGNEPAVEDVKMIDFQELRYGTPAIDLSFFMYMNTDDTKRDALWMELLKHYHKHMYETLTHIVKGINKPDATEKLEQYSFEKFYNHFARYAFYGVMICLHFLPWMLCSEEECARLSQLFETDIHSEEFYKLSIQAGGDDVNVKLLEVVKHACKMGYMDHI